MIVNIVATKGIKILSLEHNSVSHVEKNIRELMATRADTIHITANAHHIDDTSVSSMVNDMRSHGYSVRLCRTLHIQQINATREV